MVESVSFLTKLRAVRVYLIGLDSFLTGRDQFQARASPLLTHRQRTWPKGSSFRRNGDMGNAAID